MWLGFGPKTNGSIGILKRKTERCYNRARWFLKAPFPKDKIPKTYMKENILYKSKSINYSKWHLGKLTSKSYSQNFTSPCTL